MIVLLSHGTALLTRQLAFIVRKILFAELKQISREKHHAVDVLDQIQTTCCIVGAGPAGAVLALLLARQGIAVTLLEAHEDFDRDFRGDTIHPSILHIMDELGLAEGLHQFRHSKIPQASFATPNGLITLAYFRRVEESFLHHDAASGAVPLQFIADEAQRYPNFRLLMGASVQELIEDEAGVRGVRYRAADGWHEVKALLTVGTDGRSSRIRRLAGIEMTKSSPPMDVLWFRLPRQEKDPEGVLAHFGQGHALVMRDRLDEWQIAFVILKELRSGAGCRDWKLSAMGCGDAQF
jgi:2-polyprenyl-6-methoxyphenol hydroxylase-like FAD-dependent oxidoreductase